MDEIPKIKGNIVASATTSCALNIPQSVCVATNGAADTVLYAGDNPVKTYLTTTTDNVKPYILSAGGTFDNFKICDLETLPLVVNETSRTIGMDKSGYTKSDPGIVTTIIPDVIKKVLLL